MINHQRLTPFTPSRAGLLSPSAIRDPSIQKQIVNSLLPKLGDDLARKLLDGLEVRQLQRQDLEGVRVKRSGWECSPIGILRAGYIAGAENEVVRLRRLGEKLLDGVEALWRWGVLGHGMDWTG